MLCFAFFGVARAQSELTVHDGTGTNGYVPVYGYYADAYLKCEMVYPAAELAEMTGGTISSLTFYASQANVDWGTEFQVFVAEVDETTISDFAGPGTVVYEGALTISDNQMVVEFGSPYTYNGGNLLVGVYQTTTGSYLSSSWYGETVDGASVQGYSYSGLDAITATPRNFLPKTTFTYIPAGGSVCEKPATFEVTDITGYAATCTWESEVGNYTFEWKKASETDWTVVSGLTATTYQLDNLEPFTVYNTRVKAVCGTDSESGYKTANFTTLDVCPDGLVCIGEGTATNGYLPTYFFYNYSLTEQIYTADEIGTAGAIESVDIYSVGTGTRTLEIYMVNTEKRAFEGGDWIPATEGDLVFSGEVTFAANSWNTFEFDNPFIYNGTSNVALIVRDMTGSYVSGIQFFVFEAESQALYAYRDASEYDLAAPGVTGTVLSVKNRVRFAIGEPPACPKPTGLAVNYEGGTSATFTWTENGTATSWDLQYSTDAEFTEYTSAQVDGTPSFELTGLELATTYYVRVNAFCDAPSEYSNTLSFTTDACMPEEMIIVNYELADSYGDGWNGNYILVVDENCEIVEALTLQSGSSATGTVKVCGSLAQFMWYAGNYPGETSWSFTDANGNVLFAGAGNSSMQTGDVLYTIDNNPVKTPTNLEYAEVGPHSVKLSWTENGTATAWQIMIDEDEDNIIDANSNPFVVTGLDPETEYFMQVRAVNGDETSMWTCIGVDFYTTEPCPVPTNLEASDVTAISALISWNGFGESYDLRYMPIEGEDPIGGDEEKAFTGNHNMQFKASPEARPNANTRANGLRNGWYYYDNGEIYTGVGMGTGNEMDIYWGIMLPAGMTSETTLTKVALYESSTNTADTTITLYVYAGGTDAPGTLLYTEEIEPEAADDFHEIALATPVEVDPLQNLWIVFKQYGAYPAQASSDTGDANGRWISLDGEEWVDVATAGVECTWMIRAYLEGEAVMPWIDVTGINANEYELTDLTPETTYIVQVRANCGDDGQGEWTNSIEFTTGSMCDAPYDLTASDITLNSATLNWVNALESFNLKYRPIVHGEVLASANFDDSSMGEWTTIDADGDGYDWMLASASAGVYHNAGVDLTGQGHNSSADFVVSGSYTNYAGTALTPNNYLVSPQVTLGGTISFWAQAQDASYAAEHFGVAVSTTVNDDTTAFTTIQEWTMTAKDSGTKANPSTTRSGESLRAGTWYQFTVDLSAYAGQTGYVAIRHFNCTDQFILNVDDIVIEGPFDTPEWIEVNGIEKPYVLTDLTYATEYEWQVQGINPSCEGGLTEWSAIATFTTEPLPTQTISLASGTNWFSTYVEITLADLQNALVAALPGTTITIKSQNDGSTTYNGSRWRGQLNSFDVTKMYKIEVTADCEIVLEGMPLNPAEHPVTIVNGANWIGFPFSTGMTVSDAFAGFAVNGDQVSSQGNGSTTYNGSRWRGQLTNLVPGQGYNYKSAATETRTFTFPAGTK